MDLTLRDKGSLVQGFWDAVNRGTGSLANVAPLVRRIIETGAWRERVQDGKTFTNDTFLEFIVDPPLKGCGWQPDKVAALLKDDPETEALWREATTANKGKRPKDNNDNVIIKPAQGNTRAYTLDRLKRERPDLFKRVVAKELSANAAAVTAGWRKPPSPLADLRRAWRKATAAERASFLAEVQPSKRNAA